MFLQKTAFFFGKSHWHCQRFGENSKLFLFAATAWFFSSGSACCNYSYSAMQERMWLNPYPVFLELIIRIDHQWTSANQKNQSKVSGVDVFSLLFFFSDQINSEKILLCCDRREWGKFGIKHLLRTIFSTKNWYEYGIRLVGIRTSCSDFGNKNMVVTGPSKLGSWHGNIPMFSGKKKRWGYRVSMQVLGEDSETLGSIYGFTSRVLLNRKTNINSIADV